MRIQGENGNNAEVNSENELVVRAISERLIVTASRSGRAWAWDSLEISIDTGDTMLFVKNTSDKPLILDRAMFNGSNVICEWTLHIGNATTTPSGTAVAGVNMNRDNSAAADGVTALSDETAVADGDVCGRVKTPIDNSFEYDLDGFILNEGQYIQFNQETTSTSGSVILYAHFDS